jgi:hypothetical protein
MTRRKFNIGQHDLGRERCHIDRINWLRDHGHSGSDMGVGCVIIYGTLLSSLVIYYMSTVVTMNYHQNSLLCRVRPVGIG